MLEKEKLKFKEEIKELIKKENPTKERCSMLIKRIDDKIMELNRLALIKVSKEIGYEFPNDYKEYYTSLLNYNIDTNLFKVGKNEKFIKNMISMHEEHNDKYIKNYMNFASKYSNELVPIISLEFEDMVCFNRKDNSLVYYNRKEDSITKISDNWTAFKEMLYNVESK